MRAHGFVLVAVLGGLLVVGAVVFAMLFATTLDAMGARNAQLAVVEREAMLGAIHLAVAELSVRGAPWGEGGAGGHVLGPWPELGLGVTVAATPLEAAVESEGVAGAVRLVAALPPPAVRAAEVWLVALEPEVRLLRRH